MSIDSTDFKDPYVQEWREWLTNVRALAPHTVNVYCQTAEKWAEFMDYDYIGAKPEEVEGFLTRPRKGGRVGLPATQERDRAGLMQFYDYLRSHGHTQADPMTDVGVSKVRNRKPKALSDVVWTKLWNSELSDDDRLWLGLGCFAGLRRRELVDLAPGQVNSVRGLLIGVERKGGFDDVIEYRELAWVIATKLPHLLPDVDQWLNIVAGAAEQRADEPTLLSLGVPATDLSRQRHNVRPGAASPGAINSRLDTLLRQRNMKHFSPHALRHTFVTNLLRAGMPIDLVSDVAGHASVDTTRRYIANAGRLSQWRKLGGM